MTEDDELLTPGDVERLYGLKLGTQASMRSRRQIPFVQLAPRTPRYRRSDLRAWISARAVPAGAQR
jgi:hypothetical protein